MGFRDFVAIPACGRIPTFDGGWWLFVNALITGRAMDVLRRRSRFLSQPLSPSVIRVAPVVVVALATMLALWVWHVWQPGPLHIRGITLGGVLVVNMDDKTSKWSAMQVELARSSVLSKTVWGVHRLSGVIGSRCNLHEYVLQGKLTREAYGRLINQGDVVGGHFLTAGALGCYESHVRAWERVVAEGTPTMILEDDVTLRHDFDLWMVRVLERLPVGEAAFAAVLGCACLHCRIFDQISVCSTLET